MYVPISDDFCCKASFALSRVFWACTYVFMCSCSVYMGEASTEISTISWYILTAESQHTQKHRDRHTWNPITADGWFDTLTDHTPVHLCLVLPPSCAASPLFFASAAGPALGASSPCPETHRDPLTTGRWPAPQTINRLHFRTTRTFFEVRSPLSLSANQSPSTTNPRFVRKKNLSGQYTTLIVSQYTTHLHSYISLLFSSRFID